MSTKTTSRAMTWRPRYAWMPVSTRHIRNGTHIRARRSWAIGLFEHLGDRPDIEICGLHERVRALHAADGGGEDVCLRSCLLRDALDELEVAPRLGDDGLDLALLHQVDQLHEMRRRGGNSRPLLDRAHLDQPEPR